jgi:hypothetical protein
MRAKALEKDVGWDFEEDIWDEENHKGGVVLDALELQVSLEAEQRRIRDVHPTDSLKSVLKHSAGMECAHRSRKARRYMTQMYGKTWRSILRTRRASAAGSRAGPCGLPERGGVWEGEWKELVPFSASGRGGTKDISGSPASDVGQAGRGKRGGLQHRRRSLVSSPRIFRASVARSARALRQNECGVERRIMTHRSADGPAGCSLSLPATTADITDEQTEADGGVGPASTLGRVHIAEQGPADV